MCFNAINLPIELATLMHGEQDSTLKEPGVFRLWGFTLWMFGDFMVAARLRKDSDTFTVFPACRLLGIQLRECPHTSALQNLAYNVVKMLAWRIWHVPLGLGQASRWVLYLEFWGTALAFLGVCAFAVRRGIGIRMFQPLLLR